MPVTISIITRAAFCILMVLMIADGVEPILLIIPLAIFGVSQAFSGAAQSTRMVHHATPCYEDEATNFILVVNYVANALGCVMFATVYALVSGNIDVATDDQLSSGFTATMWASLILLALALICTLSVKNKIMRKDGFDSDE